MHNGSFSAPGRFSSTCSPLTRKDLAAVVFKPRKASRPLRCRAVQPRCLACRSSTKPSALLELASWWVRWAHGRPQRCSWPEVMKTAVLHRDGAALELAATGWQYGLSRRRPCRKDPAGWSSASKRLQPNRADYLLRDAEDRSSTIGKSRRVCAAACGSYFPRLPTAEPRISLMVRQNL